jgi:peptide/nickel transport system substrate-binding protein
LLLAAGAAFAALGPRYGGVLRVGVLELPAGFEPASPDSPGARLVGALVHATLVDVGPEGLPTPGLVSTWTSAAGGREWTLTLDPGARFHDDTPVTSDDALRSLRRFLRSPSPAAAWLAEGLDGGAAFRAKRTSALPGLTNPDARRLVLRFAEAQALPLAPLASPLAAITSASGLGCGPFVATSNVPGRQATLNAFGGHVRGRPYLDEVNVLALRDAPALRAELAGGRLDVALDPSVAPAPTTTAAPAGDWGAGATAVESAAHPRAAVLLLALDPTHTPFNRPEARAALQALIDRPALVRHFVPGGEAWAALVPPSLLSGFPAPPAAAPAPVSGRLSLVVARDVPQAVSQRLVALLSDGGFDVRVDVRGPLEARRAPADARLLLFVPEVAEAGLALHEIAALGPVVPEAVEALAAARVEPDLDRRRAWLLAAEQALRADDARLGLAAVPLEAVAGRGLHGLRVDGAGRLLVEDAWREP